MNLRNALSNAFVGSGGGFTGGSLTGAVSVPTAAGATIANARANGLVFGASLAAANEGISAFNGRLLFFAQAENVIYAGYNEFRFGSTVYLEWGATAATSSARTILSGGLADNTLQMGKTHATTATDQTIKAHDVTTGTGADLILKGGSGSVASGNVRFGTHAAIGIELVTGYITIKDEGGTLRKLAVIS
jgi:hypothetical protein